METGPPRTPERQKDLTLTFTKQALRKSFANSIHASSSCRRG
jgi:hypothetical protein